MIYPTSYNIILLQAKLEELKYMQKKLLNLATQKAKRNWENKVVKMNN